MKLFTLSFPMLQDSELIKLAFVNGKEFSIV